MAVFVHFMSGPCVVEFDGEELGLVEDRVTVRVNPFYDDIHTDHMGGLAGAPSDSQFLGAIADVTCMFTKYVKAEMDKLTSFDVGGTGGTLPTLGSFIKQDGLYGALVLKATNEQLTFEVAHIRQAQEFNVSLRHKRYAVGFQCWIDDACTRQLYTIATGEISCTP